MIGVIGTVHEGHSHRYSLLLTSSISPQQSHQSSSKSLYSSVVSMKYYQWCIVDQVSSHVRDSLSVRCYWSVSCCCSIGYCSPIALHQNALFVVESLFVLKALDTNHHRHQHQQHQQHHEDLIIRSMQHWTMSCSYSRLATTSYIEYLQHGMRTSNTYRTSSSRVITMQTLKSPHRTSTRYFECITYCNTCRSSSNYHCDSVQRAGAITWHRMLTPSRWARCNLVWTPSRSMAMSSSPILQPLAIDMTNSSSYHRFVEQPSSIPMHRGSSWWTMIRSCSSTTSQTTSRASILLVCSMMGSSLHSLVYHCASRTTSCCRTQHSYMLEQEYSSRVLQWMYVASLCMCYCKPYLAHAIHQRYSLSLSLSLSLYQSIFAVSTATHGYVYDPDSPLSHWRWCTGWLPRISQCLDARCTLSLVTEAL